MKKVTAVKIQSTVVELKIIIIKQLNYASSHSNVTNVRFCVL